MLTSNYVKLTIFIQNYFLSICIIQKLTIYKILSILTKVNSCIHLYRYMVNCRFYTSCIWLCRICINVMLFCYLSRSNRICCTHNHLSCAGVRISSYNTIKDHLIYSTHI
nr:MAG TPA: hypothetical protein [Bacteriophage sp.]